MKKLSIILSLFMAANSWADGPPQSNGVISNPTLVANQNVAKAQAAGAITSFMSEGAKTCDADGKNCVSLFGADDTPDYTRLQASSQSLTGVSAFSFMDDDASGSGGDAKSISSQMGTLALACGDTSVKKVAGLAVKVTSCAVTATGDSSLTVQICSAPMRGNPVTPPANEVVCSADPSASNFRAPTGFVCKRPACDSEQLGSLDGWSQPQTISYSASLPTTATAEQKSKNGLGLVFYPPLTGGVTANLNSDSDSMTAVKVVQTFVNNETQRTAVGLKIAYRYKTQVTKEMMVQGPSSVTNPSANTAQWDTILKLQGNEKIPQYQQKYGAAGSDCLQQITTGMAKDGVVSVCDQTYTNESGIKPLAKTAQVATEGEDCGTTPQCLKEVVNTNTWQETCQVEVPLSMRSCTTTQDYAMEDISWTRTRTQEVCHEQRAVNEYGCATRAVVSGVSPLTCPAGTLLVNRSEYRFNGFSDPYLLFRVQCLAGDKLRVQLGTSMGGGEFDTASLYGFTFYAINQDIQMSAFLTATQSAGTDCAGYGNPNTFNISCTGTTCTYSIQVGHSQGCFFASVSPYMASSAGFGYNATYTTINDCTAYESAR